MSSSTDLRFVETEFCKVEKHLGTCAKSGKNEYLVRTEHGVMTVRDTGYEIAGIPCATLIERETAAEAPVKTVAA